MKWATYKESMEEIKKWFFYDVFYFFFFCVSAHFFVVCFESKNQSIHYDGQSTEKNTPGKQSNKWNTLNGFGVMCAVILALDLMKESYETMRYENEVIDVDLGVPPWSNNKTHTSMNGKISFFYFIFVFCFI